MYLGFTQTPTVYDGDTASSIGAATLLFTNDSLEGSDITIPHGFDTENVIVQVYDENNRLILPSEITVTDSNNVTVSLACGTPIEGTWRVTVLADQGGQNVLGSYATDFNQASLVDGILTVNHTLGSEYLVVQVYDDNNRLILPSEIEILGTNTVQISLECGTPITGTWRVTIVATQEGLGIIEETPTNGSPYWELVNVIEKVDALDTSVYTTPWDFTKYNSIKVVSTSYTEASSIELTFNNDMDPNSYQNIGDLSYGNIELDGDGVTDASLEGSLVNHGGFRLLRLSKADQAGIENTSINWLNSLDDVSVIGVKTTNVRCIVHIYGR